jgi:hypothetical protein
MDELIPLFNMSDQHGIVDRILGTCTGFPLDYSP